MWTRLTIILQQSATADHILQFHIYNAHCTLLGSNRVQPCGEYAYIYIYIYICTEFKNTVLLARWCCKIQKHEVVSN